MIKENTNYDECYALIEKLKNNPNIPRKLIEDIENMISLQKEIIGDLNDLAIKYEGIKDDTAFEKLEKSLINFKRQKELAKDLQSVIFPQSLPDNNLLSINLKFCPMCETSGDFYDVAEIVPNSVYGIFLADIAGHGVSAALITNLAKVLFLNAADKFSSPGDTMKYINNEICNILNYKSYFTAIYIVADFPNKRITYASAGHPYGLRYNSVTKEIKKLHTKNTVIGVLKGIEYYETSFHFNVGDKLIIYTDGISEARNEEGKMFGDKNLIEIIREHLDLPSNELVNIIEEEVKKHTKKNTFDDDFTLMTIDIRSDKDRDDSSKKKGFFTNEETDKLIEYYSKSLEIKKKEKDEKGLIRNMRLLGTHLIKKGYADEAIKYIEESLRMSIKIGGSQLIGDSYYSLGSIFYSKGEHDKSKEYLEKALEYYIKVDHKDGIASSYNIISNIYGRISDTQKQREYIMKALEVDKENIDNIAIARRMAILYNNLGASYHKEEDIGTALEYYLKSLYITNKYDIIYLQATLLNNTGAVYMQRAEFDKALKSLHKSLSLTEQLANKDTQCIIIFNIATIYYTQGEKELALYYLKKGVEISVAYNFLYNESLLRTIRGEYLLKMDRIDEGMEDILRGLSLNKQYNFDPSRGYVKTIIGMLIHKVNNKEMNKDTVFMNNYNTIISYYDNNIDPNYYYESAIEESFSKKVLDIFFSATREYVSYLYSINPIENKEKIISLLNKGYKEVMKNYNVWEKNNYEKLASEINLRNELTEQIDTL